MALILAIEPDRRQAAQLASLIQARVGAELVLAETTEQALGVIGNRVPDLVLVPALLAPQDDATLATALRVIAAAAHVQMLTIPVLAPADGARQRRGVLSRWRRAAAPAPDGCDPSVFGDQIAAYLAEAAAERAITRSDLEMGLAISTVTDRFDATNVLPDQTAGFAAVEQAGPDRAALRAAALGIQCPPAVEDDGFGPSATDSHLLCHDTPDLGVDGRLDGERWLETPAVVDLPAAAIEAFTLAEPTAVHSAAVDVTAIFEAPLPVETFVLAEPTVDHTAAIDVSAIDVTLPAEAFVLAEAAVDDSAAVDLKAPLETTTPVEAFRLAEPTVVASAAVDVTASLEVVADEEAVFAAVPLGQLDAVAAAPSSVGAVENERFDRSGTRSHAVSQPVDLSNAPRLGPQRRWPDLEGVAAVDHIPVFTVEATADAAVQMASFPAEVPAPPDDMPAVVIAMEPPAPLVVEEAPIDMPDASPAIEIVLLEDSPAAARLELWMPLSSGSSRSWPALEGVWSEARPEPPPPVPYEPPVFAAAPPAVIAAAPAVVAAPPAVAVAPPSVAAAPPAVAAAPPTVVVAPPHVVVAPPHVVVAPPLVAAAAHATSPVEARVPAQDAPAARPEWIELIESLRQDVKRLRSERSQPAPAVVPRSKAAAPPLTRPLPPPRPPVAAGVETTPRKRAKAAKPAQDEWGFFDPEQCGFAALLAKLDEITDVNDGA